MLNSFHRVRLIQNLKSKIQNPLHFSRAQITGALLLLALLWLVATIRLVLMARA